MRPLIIFGLTLLLIGGCSTNRSPLESGFSKSSRAERNGLKFQSMKVNVNSPQYRRAQKEKPGNQGLLSAKNSPLSGNKTISFYSSNDKIFLPTIAHAQDRSLMVLVNWAGRLNPRRGIIRLNRAGSSNLPAFYMDLLEVAVDQYKTFEKAYDEKPFTNGKKCPGCPAMGIDWASADSYCRWAGKRLPTEAEWIAAAGGNSGNLWPWGNTFSSERANLSGNEDGSFLAASVGSYPQGASPHGLLDMAGNVWEWVGYSPLPSQKGSKARTPRPVKGGGWTSDKQSARISFRNLVDPDMKNPTIGFRCAKSIR